MARGRELESAEKELAGTRAMFERKMVELEARWRRVESRYGLKKSRLLFFPQKLLNTVTHDAGL